MLRSSLPLGRWMGVDLRLHISFPLLFGAAVAYGVAITGSAGRGIGVFAALLFAVAVREVGRSVAAAYAGMRLKVIFLLPIGGVMAFAPDTESPNGPPQALVLAAPLANFSVGLLILGLSYASAPGIDLLHQPWISAGHVLRSFVWMQFALGALSLLPAVTLPNRQAQQPAEASSRAVGALGSSSTGFSVMLGLSLALCMAGFVTANLWLVMLGGFGMLYAQLRAHTSGPAAAGGDGLLVADVMTSDFLSLSASETLRSALEHTAASAQDVFPIVRGGRIVGAVSRQTLNTQMQTEGDGYIQGLMTRTLQTANPDETLGTALARASQRGSTDCIPVVHMADDSRVLGILTPESVSRAMQVVKLTRLRDEPRAARS